jgi:hypothetical protein
LRREARLEEEQRPGAEEDVRDEIGLAVGEPPREVVCRDVLVDGVGFDMLVVEVDGRRIDPEPAQAVPV